MRKNGFTLIELSIVLVIIGLLIGGILAAQSMISTARIQAQIRQLQQFDVAITNFKQKYNQIPGDTTLIQPLAGKNNDGKLSNIAGLTPPTSLDAEPYYFFSDLSVSQDISENYQILPNQYQIGVNNQFPKAAIGRGGLVVSGNAFGDIYYTFIYKGTTAAGFGGPAYSTLMAQGVFSSTEALAIDTKIDDGNPYVGNVQAVKSSVAASTSIIPFDPATDSATTCVYNTQYNISVSSTSLCRIVVKSNFQQ